MYSRLDSWVEAVDLFGHAMLDYKDPVTGEWDPDVWHECCEQDEYNVERNMYEWPHAGFVLRDFAGSPVHHHFTHRFRPNTLVVGP